MTTSSPRDPSPAWLWWLVPATLLGGACPRDGAGGATMPTDPVPPAGGEDPGAGSADPDGLRDRFYWTGSDGPEPLACHTDDDCTTGMRVGQDGCCLADPPALVPMTRDYSYWLGRRRGSAECRDADCPPPPQASIPNCGPTPPPDCCFRDDCPAGWSPEQCPCCDFHVRCVDGWCRNACTRDWQAQIPETPAP